MKKSCVGPYPSTVNFYVWLSDALSSKRITKPYSEPIQTSEQLPCRSAEVKFFSVFLCQRCREIWREIMVKFSVLRFPGFGGATENFTKISRRKRCENGKFHANFTLLGRSTDKPYCQTIETVVLIMYSDKICFLSLTVGLARKFFENWHVSIFKPYAKPYSDSG